MAIVQIEHFSDLLCVWAYFSEPRIAEVQRNFGDSVRVTFRFVPVFGDVAGKMAAAWQAKGGYAGFADHVQHSAANFPEIQLNPALWREVRPASSLGVHLYLKAIELSEAAGQSAAGSYASAISKVRAAFFVQGRNIAHQDVLQDIGASVGAAPADVLPYLADGRAHAALSADYKAAETLAISGSPTLVLNQGRQKLYGNVGYRIIEANIQELLRNPNPGDASWC